MMRTLIHRLGLAALMLVAPSSAYAACPGDGLLARLVPCIAKTMESTTVSLTNALSTYMWPATVALLTLAIIIYGVRIMTPEGNVQKTALPFLLKVAFIIFFVKNFGGFIPYVHGSMYNIVDIISNALPAIDSEECKAAGGAAGLHASNMIWENMDCVLGKLFGFVSGRSGNALLVASIFGLMAGFFFGGSFGLIAFFAIIGVLWSIFMFVFRAAFAFLNAFMLASFMVIISPIFIPLLIFQVTGGYFQAWLRIFMGSFIMPIMVIGYCVFALSIYNDVLFNEDSAISINRIMDFNFSSAIAGERTECLGTLMNSVVFRQFEAAFSGQSLDDVMRNNSVQNMSIPQQSGGQGLCIKVPEIDLQRMSGEFANTQDFFRKVFTEGMSLLILAWVLGAAMKVILDMTAAMGAGVAQALMTSLSPTEKRLQKAWDDAKASAMRSMTKEDGSQYAGVEFMQRVPIAFREMVSGGVRGVQ